MPHSALSQSQNTEFDPARLADDGVTVIIPTLNEVDNIGPILDRLLSLEALCGRLEIIVADDHSDDGTLDEVRARQRRHPVFVSQRRGPPDLAASVLEAARLARGRW
ncbi:MAG: glycosyltransferase [Xanthomonadaceae bacterium]|nr:glycosyltransferase [Xanthomonadaceae bacterium]